MGKYQIFVSYRREGGDMLAGRVADNLTQRGYRVFFDVEAMRSGEFNEQIYDAIDGCSDFIMILSTTPNALERCKNEGDWVRRELGYALKKGKNIIPVFARDYEFPEELPDELEGIRNKQGIHASRDFFPEAMDRLVSYLKAKLPGSRRSPSQKAAQAQAAPLKSEIRLPLLLKTPQSRFLDWGQGLLAVLNEGHDLYWQRMKLTWEHPRETYVDIIRKAQRREWFEQNKEELARRSVVDLEERFVQIFDEQYHQYSYDLYRMYDWELSVQLEKHLFSKIHDQTLLRQKVTDCTGHFNTIRQYISGLYESKCPYYQSRVAELLLLWGLTDLSFCVCIMDVPMGGTGVMHVVSQSPLRAAIESTFQNANIPGFLQKTVRETIGHGAPTEKLRSHRVFTEVSFTLQQIAQSQDAAEADSEIREFLNALFACWQLRATDVGMGVGPGMGKAMKRYLQINYKYLLKQGIELSDETMNLLQAFLTACDES